MIKGASAYQDSLRRSKGGGRLGRSKGGAGCGEDG